MLLVYTHKITPRITYIFKHICMRVLGVPVSFTTKVEELIAHKGPKMSYTTKRLGNELFLRSTDLLFEQGVLASEVTMRRWDGLLGLFPVKDASSDVPFDIFAASFYLLSRYEEYLPHVKDSQGRYSSSESLAVTQNFLKTPIVDIWIERFAIIFSNHFPSVQFKKLVYRQEIMVSIPQSNKYSKIGFLRTMGGYMKDMSKLRLLKVFKRTQVLLGFKKDPYDIFNWLVNVQKQVDRSFKIFIQLGDYSEDTRNIKHSRKSFMSSIKMIADYCKVGLLLSPQAIKDASILAKERKRLEALTHRPLKHIHLSDYKLILPHVYREAIEQEIQHDYTMGYPDVIGFRAGTSHSFLFYDLDYEIQTPLMIHPVAIQSDSIVNYKNHTIDTVSLKDMQQITQRVGGTFRINFSNTSFEDVYSKKLFRSILFDD